MIIAITGTPGTGKTTLAKKLVRRHGYRYMDVNALITRHRLYERYDRKLKTKIIDPKKLVRFLIPYTKSLKAKGVVIDSHLSHYLPPSLVDRCYVTTCGLTVLKQRLKKRGYSTQKIRDNLEAEVFQACLTEAQEFGHRVIVRDTSKEK
ncbi:TPA: AAA family ATPase [Candidatus Woesearchaeota archaeon]|nr:AAA family ATPase [Candidatus Woesearchaeota archaeon]HIJ19345.1 AAA family ATPase [Candidatus Woesearchaeota archaeon]